MDNRHFWLHQEIEKKTKEEKKMLGKFSP